jgi:trigger factor
MQANIKKQEGIHCDLGVTIPAEEIDSKVTQKLKEMTKTLRINGFRPGKVPYKYVKDHYSQNARAEIINNMLSDKYSQAIEKQNINAAGVNDVKIDHDKPGEDLQLTFQIELFPEVNVEGIENLTIEQPVTEVGDEEVRRMIEGLQKQSATWHQVNRPCQKGDAVKVDYHGTIDGEPFEGGSQEGEFITLGENQMLQDFEAALYGMSPGERKTFDVTFPDDYAQNDLAGQTASFEVTVHEVQEPELPEIDEEFAKSYGIEGDKDTFIHKITENMKHQLKTARRNYIKSQIFEQLPECADFELPKTLVNQQIKRSKENLLKQMGDNAKHLNIDQMPDHLFQQEAEKQVRLSFIIESLIEKHQLEPSDNDVEALIEEIASEYEDPQQAKAQFQNDEKEMENIRSLARENALIEWLLDHVQLVEKEKDYFELIQQGMQNQQ